MHLRFVSYWRCRQRIMVFQYNLEAYKPYLLSKLPKIRGDSVLLLNKTKHPIDTLYYCAACILNELSLENQTVFIDELFEKIKNKYNSKLVYNDFLLALNFLYLIDKIELTARGIELCI